MCDVTISPPTPPSPLSQIVTISGPPSRHDIIFGRPLSCTCSEGYIGTTSSSLTPTVDQKLNFFASQRYFYLINYANHNILVTLSS